MQIDCRSLECPKPVLLCRDSLESLIIGETLEVLLNSAASLANVKKFLKANDLEFQVVENSAVSSVFVKKTKELSSINPLEFCDIQKNKILFLKDDKVGSGPIGKSLLTKFLSSILSIKDSRPTHIVCVNEAVLITTDRSNANFAVLKELEKSGIKILSCGSCLEALGIVDKLLVGEIGNAFEIMNLLLENETVCL